MYDYHKMNFDRLIDLRNAKQRRKAKIAEIQFLTTALVDEYGKLSRQIQQMNAVIAARQSQLWLDF